MADLSLYENGNGGDIVLLGNDIEMTDSFFNMVYMALFGGNPNFPTTGNETKDEQRFDWYGNTVFLQNDKEFQFNSTLENTLNKVALNSEGRILIEESAKNDLQFLTTFAIVDVEVSILADDKCSIYVTLTEPSNLDAKKYQFIWDSTKNEVINSEIL